MTFLSYQRWNHMLEQIFVTYKINEQFGSVGNNFGSYWKTQSLFSQCQDSDTDYLKTCGSWALPVRAPARVWGGGCSHHSALYPQSRKGELGVWYYLGCVQNLTVNGSLTRASPSSPVFMDTPNMIIEYVGNGEQAKRDTRLATSNLGRGPFYSASGSLRTCWKG